MAHNIIFLNFENMTNIQKHIDQYRELTDLLNGDEYSVAIRGEIIKNRNTIGDLLQIIIDQKIQINQLQEYTHSLERDYDRQDRGINNIW